MTRPGLTLATHHSGILSGSHARLRWLLGQRTVRVDVDPHLTTTLDVTGDRNTGRLDLPVRYVGRFEADAVGTKVTRVPPLAAPVRLGWCCLRCLTLRGINMISPPCPAGAASAVPPTHRWPALPVLLRWRVLLVDDLVAAAPVVSAGHSNEPPRRRLLARAKRFTL